MWVWLGSRGAEALMIYIAVDPNQIHKGVVSINYTPFQ